MRSLSDRPRSDVAGYSSNVVLNTKIFEIFNNSFKTTRKLLNNNLPDNLGEIKKYFDFQSEDKI